MSIGPEKPDLDDLRQFPDGLTQYHFPFWQLRGFDMATESIMTSALFTVLPTDTVEHALSLMHRERVQNLPVVEASGKFIGLFGLRRLGHLLLPKAASSLSKHSVSDLYFLPDETVENAERWREISEQPVSQFLEKKKKLLFCQPDTSFPKLLALLEESKDSSLPVLVVEGKKRKLVGMVSSWDVLEGVIMGRLIGQQRQKSTNR